MMALNRLSVRDHNSLIDLAAQYFDVVPGRSAFFKDSLLQERRWVAVLFECDFKEAASKVAAAISTRLWNKALCFNVEYPEDKAFTLTLNKEDLYSVHSIYPAPSYTIVEYDYNFAIVSDSDYFWSIAGPLGFISDVCNQTVSKELDVFSNGIQSYLLSSDAHNKTMGEQMLQYLKQCRARLSEYAGA